MKITLKEWIELYQLAKEVADRKDALEASLLRMLLEHNKAGNLAETILLTRLFSRDDVCPYMYFPQNEWTGGPSDDPRNHTLREPNWVQMGHSFPPEEVDEFRDEDGVVRFPKLRNGEVVYYSIWDEDEDYPVQDWQHEVAEDNTRAGYWDWVASQKELHADSE